MLADRMAEVMTWIAVLIVIGVIVFLYIKGEREGGGIRGGPRLRAVFDPQERERRQACQEEWNGVVLFMFPQDPWTARKQWQHGFEDWYREWRVQKTPAYKYWRKMLGRSSFGVRLRFYPEWVKDGAPNPLTWIPQEERERKQEWDERMRQVEERQQEIKRRLYPDEP